MRQVSAADVADLASAILDPDRRHPIVAVTTRAGKSVPDIDLNHFVADVGEMADVVLLQTGEATWELTDLLPDRLDVYGGALRVWWPGVDKRSDPYDHPLFIMYGERDARQKLREVVDELKRARPVAQTRSRRPQPGEIVTGTVTQIVSYGAFIEVEGHRGLAHISHLSEEWVGNPEDIVEVGDEVRARVLDTPDGRLAFSFRNAAADQAEPAPLLLEEVRRLKDEVRELAAERRELLVARKHLQERVRQLEQRKRERRRDDEITLLDEDYFRSLVNDAYEERYRGDDRTNWPLRPYELNKAFLPSVRTLDGISTDKIVEVCVHAITGRARRFDGLAVHPLRRGKGSTEQIARGRDGAKAWRCALQRESAGARRLHWWEIPGGSVELASVGHHDDASIPG